MSLIFYFLSGLVFAFGLSIAGMTDPVKVKSFLEIGFSNWDPSLAFVLGAAIPAYGAVFLFLRRREKTFNGQSFAHPTPRRPDIKLVLGSAIFGVGWGVAGVCPGPALANLFSGGLPIFVFLFTMVAGFELQRRVA